MWIILLIYCQTIIYKKHVLIYSSIEMPNHHLYNSSICYAKFKSPALPTWIIIYYNNYSMIKIHIQFLGFIYNLNIHISLHNIFQNHVVSQIRYRYLGIVFTKMHWTLVNDKPFKYCCLPLLVFIGSWSSIDWFFINS